MVKKKVIAYWHSILHIGHIEGMTKIQEMRLFTLNAFVFITSILTILFVLVFSLVGSSKALQGLFTLPALVLIGYCNYKHKHTLAQFLVIYLLLFLVLGLALLDRRTGTEYILIALGCASVLLFERKTMIFVSFLIAFLCYAFYSWYDATHEFVPDPNTPYIVIQNSLMFLSGLSVVAESFVFRSLIQNYAISLQRASAELVTLNKELRASNEELLSFTDNLDLTVKQKKHRTPGLY